MAVNYTPSLSSGLGPSPVKKSDMQAWLNEISNGIASLDPRATPIYASRASAVSAAPGLPASLTHIMVREGTALVIRSRTASADDPLFTSGAQWGVVMRQDIDSSISAEAAQRESADNALADRIAENRLSTYPVSEFRTKFEFVSDLRGGYDGSSVLNLMPGKPNPAAINSPALIATDHGLALRCLQANEQGVRGTFGSTNVAAGTIGGRVHYRGPFLDGNSFRRIAALGRAGTTSTNTNGCVALVYRGVSGEDRFCLFSNGGNRFTLPKIETPFDFALQYSETVLRLFINSQKVFEGAPSSPANINAFSSALDIADSATAPCDLDIYGLFAAPRMLTLTELEAARNSISAAPSMRISESAPGPDTPSNVITFVV